MAKMHGIHRFWKSGNIERESIGEARKGMEEEKGDEKRRWETE